MGPMEDAEMPIEDVVANAEQIAIEASKQHVLALFEHPELSMDNEHARPMLYVARPFVDLANLVAGQTANHQTIAALHDLLKAQESAMRAMRVERARVLKARDRFEKDQ